VVGPGEAEGGVAETEGVGVSVTAAVTEPVGVALLVPE